MFKNKYQSVLVILVITLFMKAPAWGQENGKNLALDSLLQEMIHNNPDVLRAKKSLDEVDIQMKIIEDNLKSVVNGVGSYTRIGPVTTFDFPGLGEFKLNSADNYEASINYDQTIFDFGKTENASALENERKELLHASIGQLQQKLSIQLIHTYYQVVFIQNALKINEEEQANLDKHLQTVKKKLEAGTSTKYVILSTQVRLSKLDSKRVDLEALRNKELAVLEHLVGYSFSKSIEFPDELPELVVSTEVDGLLNHAFENRDELKIAMEQEKLSELKSETIKDEMKPEIGIHASVGGKNGYTPDLNQVKANFTAGVGVHIPIYDGSKKKHRLALEQVRLDEFKYATESTKRAVKEDVVRAVEDFRAAKLKSEKEKLQVQQAEEAYKLAEVSFDSGVITNLDLLDASTNLEDSKLQLLKTNIDYLLAGYNVSLAMGDKLYEIN